MLADAEHRQPDLVGEFALLDDVAHTLPRADRPTSVMSVLSEPDDRTLQMSQLAALTNASLSRLSHVITRLEKKGWVTRCPSAENGRITTARLTDEGFAALDAAAPGHVEAVRELVFDALTPTQVEQLAEISEQILDRLDPGGDWPPRRR